MVFLLTLDASHKFVDSDPIFIHFRPFRVDPLQCLSANWLNNRFSAADFQLGDGGPDIWLCGGYWTLAVGPESKALDVLLESDLRTLVAQGEGYRSISVFIEILNAGFSVGCE